MTRYPLEALLALRERDVDASRAALGAAAAQEARAAADLERARGTRAALLARRNDAIARGGAGGAGALQRIAAFAARLRTEEERAAADVASGEARLARTGAEVARAREALAEADRARAAIARHRAAWQEGRRRAAERAEDAAHDDLAAARARRDGER